MIWTGGILALAATLAWVVGAVLSAGACVWLCQHGERTRPDRPGLVTASLAAAVWCLLAAVLGSGHDLVVMAVMVRNLALIATIFNLFAADGRSDSLKPVRPLIVALVMVQLLQPVVLLAGSRVAGAEQAEAAVTSAGLLIDMLVAIGALMLLHNLYAGADTALRPALRWTGMALAGIFAYDLNLHALSYLGAAPTALGEMSGLFAGAMAVIFALGMSAAGARVQFSPSRTVTFRTLSLLLIGTYLAALALMTKALALIAGDEVRAGQAMFAVLGILAAAVALPSPKLRAWLRVTATKHLFQHRYDYREEWLRFTRTIGRGGTGHASLEERAVKALADMTQSPAGLLLMPGEDGRLELTARWNWTTLAVPAEAGNAALCTCLEEHNLILALDEVRAGTDRVGELGQVPGWLLAAEEVWALVPLIHFDRLVGVIVLARPPGARQLDWEDFDLLRVAGQQLASYLAEQAGQQALMEASRFDEFNRRMAFVMHDIKNLVSQLSLLAANAEKHADNPAFRADMLMTLRNSVDKLSALLARLGRYGSGQVWALTTIDLVELARAVAERFRGVHPVSLTREEPVRVTGNREALEQALIHLVQNAIDASGPVMPVSLDASAQGDHGIIEVVDAGRGMSPEFVRSGLFKPFVSSKSGGFGIGAFEARELVRAMGGRIAVESREGIGTRFMVELPLSGAARVIDESGAQTQSSRELA